MLNQKRVLCESGELYELQVFFSGKRIGGWYFLTSLVKLDMSFEIFEFNMAERLKNVLLTLPPFYSGVNVF